LNGQSGFTLIEVLAAGLISTIVAGALLSVLYMSTGQIRDGASSLRLSQSQAVVSEQIRTSARKAFGAWSGSCPDPGPSDLDAAEALVAGYAGSGQLKQVVFCDPLGAILSGYSLETDGRMYEWVGGSFRPFRIGADEVMVDYAASNFIILARRRGIIFNIIYRRDAGGESYFFPLIQETVLSRNRRNTIP
jgi:type II secretory pathway pseudopilin PulG